MGFQQRPPRRAPSCPWCDQEMVPSADSRGGRLYCPTGEAVEYRLSGGRWYFNGRLNGLDEPVPPAPDAEAVSAGVDAWSKPSDPRDALDAPVLPASPDAQKAPEAPDPLDAFRQIASDAWGVDDADGGGGAGSRG